MTLATVTMMDFDVFLAQLPGALHELWQHEPQLRLWTYVYLGVWCLPILFAFLRQHRSKWAILLCTLLAPPLFAFMVREATGHRIRSWFTMLRWSLSSGIINY
jgi:hypothetical protein